ncbi:MAG: thaumatin family protein [Myxococcota bacterium]
MVRPAALLVTMALGCGFVDGEPLVGAPIAGSTGSTSMASTSTDDGLDSTSMGVVSSTGTADASDSTGTPSSCTCEGLEAGQRCVRLVNACDEPLDAGLTGSDNGADIDLFMPLAPGECVAVTINELIAGRAFAARGCDEDACDSNGNDGRGSLIQLTLRPEADDVYDVSLVRGFNVPMALVPVGIDQSPVADQCPIASCAADLNVVCPDGLVRTGTDGDIAYCASPCDACDECPGCTSCGDVGTPVCDPCAPISDLCCTGQQCEPNEYTMVWKSLCPDAITDPEDGTAFSCDQNPDYDVVFCP